MRAGEEYAADWRDGSAYAPLLQVGRAGFAWEWLRRDESYRLAAVQAAQSSESLAMPGSAVNPDAARFGLLAFEPPDRPAIAARPVWSREICPYVLQADAADEGDEQDRLNLHGLGRLVTLVASQSGAEHLLLSDGSHTIRVDIVSGTLRGHPACLHYRLTGFCRLKEPLLVLRQLLALQRTGRFSPMLHPRERPAGRWILLLRTFDALAAGASQRDIAERLFGLEAAGRRWRVEASSVRSRVQRLVREGRRMAAGEYLSLLGGR